MAVLARRRPADLAARVLDGGADRLELRAAVQPVRRRGCGADLPSERLGDDECAAREVEAVRRRAGGGVRERALERSVALHLVGRDPVGHTLRDDEGLAAGCEGDLGAVGLARAQRRGGDRRQAAVGREPEAGDPVVPEDVDKVAVDGDAPRPAAGCRAPSEKLQAPGLDRKDGDVVAAGVDDEEAPAVGDERALRG